LNECQNDTSRGLWVAVRENREWKTKNGEPTLATSNQDAFDVDLQWQSGIRALTVEVEVQPPLVEFEWGAVEFEWGAGKVKEERM